MTGVYTDNQPDFTWIQPYEEKTFTQYFLPYKTVGQVKNASIDIIMGLETENFNTTVKIYATSVFNDIIVTLKGKNGIYIEKSISVSPTDIYEKTVETGNESEEDLILSVKTSEGRELLSYQAAPKGIVHTPDPAKAIGKPEELKDVEALYLAGMHLEQYRHATYEPDGYYLEGLKRAPKDIRLKIGRASCRERVLVKV